MSDPKLIWEIQLSSLKVMSECQRVAMFFKTQEEHEEMHRKESEPHDPLLPGLDSSKRRYSQ
jgi:hypothetical protein